MYITVDNLLKVFYEPFWDMARLLQASATERDLDPARAKHDAFGNKEHTWHWCCTEPVLLMKVWSDLYQLRFHVPYADRQRFAPPQLFENCMDVYSRLGTLALLIDSTLAKRYVDEISSTNDPIWSKAQATRIRTLRAEGRHSESVAAYMKARIDEALAHVYT